MAAEYTNLEKIRLEKVETLRAEGIEPYPTRAERTHFSQEAIQAFENKTNISNNLAVETILYASAQRQIKKAVKMLGIRQDSSNIAVLIITENVYEKNEWLKFVEDIVSGQRDDKILELNDKKFIKIKKLFEISDLELEAKLWKEGQEKQALIDLLIEHMALLGTKS